MTEIKRPSQRGRPKRVAPSAASVRLPEIPFLYTLDQVAIIVGWSKQRLHARTFYVGRTLDRKLADQIEAFNIALPTQKPDWRVSERELIRWLIRHGYQPQR